MSRAAAFVALVISLASFTASACSCANYRLEDDDFAEAKHVFVFRLLSSHLFEAPPDQRGRENASGRIRIVEVLRGAPPPTDVSFSTGWCCGTKLEVGHYYLAATSVATGIFDANPGSVVEVSRRYWEGQDNWGEHGLLSVLAPALSGELPLSEVFPFGERATVESTPAPPPPPPPPSSSPCPESSARDMESHLKGGAS